MSTPKLPPHRLTVRARTLCLALSLSVWGCRAELGDCDQEAAQELVYSSAGLVATKGQALLHDSCGQGTTCHAAGAKGKNRAGAPFGLDFDVLPRPSGVAKVLQYKESIWDQVSSGLMPPSNYTAADSDWSFDLERSEHSQKLTGLDTREGKAALRNWLACGAPSVADSKIPDWAVKPETGAATAESEWTDLHAGLRRNCTAAGCHDGSYEQSIPDWASTPLGSAPPDGFPDGSVPGVRSVPFATGECATYKWLLYQRDACGQRLVLGGSPAESSLIDKLENERPRCGAAMPPEHEETKAAAVDDLKARARSWVERGALAPQCGEWSTRAPRTSSVDASVDPGPAQWSDLYARIIGPRCATVGCHVSASAALSGQLDLSDRCKARRALLEDKGPCGVRVTPGDVDSMLIDKVANNPPSCNAAMPPGVPLRSDEIAALRAWIEQGAEADDCP